MNELALALLFIFPATAVLLFYLAKFLIMQKNKALFINEKIAPFLFPLYLLLSASFRLTPVRNFLEWLGISYDLVVVLLFFAVFDNIFLFIIHEKRVEKILKAYMQYLRHDTAEFFLVVLLSLLSGIVAFFKTRTFSFSPLVAAAAFLGVLLLLPLILFQYRDIQWKFKLEIKSVFFLNLIKLTFFLICPLIFLKLLKLLFITSSNTELITTFSLWSLELIILVLFWKKIIKIPKLITQSTIYKNTETTVSKFLKKSTLFIYNHIEIAAVVLLILIVSWPIAMARIDEYRNWRSNFPVIKKALPVIGMQGSMVILIGDNFGTTGLGIPGKVMVGDKGLMIAEWNDHKIIAIVPVPPPSGKLFIRKNFKWDGKGYITNSNQLEFAQFDWAKADQKEVEKFLEMLKEQYQNSL